MPQVFAYACDDKTSVFHRTTIEIREPAFATAIFTPPAANGVQYTTL